MTTAATATRLTTVTRSGPTEMGRGLHNNDVLVVVVVVEIGFSQRPNGLGCHGHARRQFHTRFLALALKWAEVFSFARAILTLVGPRFCQLNIKSDEL